MPTLNSERTLEKSLGSIKKQKYPANVNIYVIDGGSSDKTLEICSRLGVSVLEEKGKYMHGTNGAYDVGIKSSHAPLILRIDSDNVLVEDDFIQKLVYPLVEDQSINLSVSISSYGNDSTCYEKYGSIVDQHQLKSIASLGHYRGEYAVVEDLSHGLTNCVIFRRKDFNKVGEFISDTSYLISLGVRGLSKAAINLSCHYIHYSIPSYRSQLQKMIKRVKRVSKEIGNYKVKDSDNSDSVKNEGITIKSYMRAVRANVKDLLRYRNRIYLCGLLLAIAPLIAMAIHPLSAARIYFSYLRKLTGE